MVATPTALENVLRSEVYARNVSGVWYTECYHKINCEPKGSEIEGGSKRV